MDNCKSIIILHYKREFIKKLIYLVLIFIPHFSISQFSVECGFNISKQLFADYIEEFSFESRLNGIPWRQATKLKLGEGNGLNMHFIYLFKNNFSVGLGLNYFNNDVTTNKKIMETYTRISRFQNNRFSFETALGYRVFLGKVNCRTEIGIHYRINDKLKNDITIMDNSINYKLHEKSIHYDNFNMGIQFRVNLQHKIVKKIPMYIIYYLENNTHMYSHDRGYLISYIVNGNELIQQLNLRSKQFLYSDQYTVSKDITNEDPNKPQYRLKEYYSISQLTFGIKLSFTF